MPEPESVGVYCLDVGQGDCTFVLGPPDVAVLCDCADAAVAARFVGDHGIQRLEAVVITHLDLDHIQGMLPFLRTFLAGDGTIGTVYVDRDRRLADVRARRAASALLTALLAWEEAGVLALGAPDADGTPKQVAGDTTWAVEIALPTHAAKLRLDLADHRDANRRSAVLRITRGTTAVLVGGDAPLSSWQNLPSTSLQASAIRAPHHGGDLGRPSPGGLTTRSLYAGIGPKHAIISVGTLNTHEHPSPTHVGDIRACGAALRCTQLTPRCDPAPAAFRAAALANVAAVAYPYRHYRGTRAAPSTEVPCAGSVIVILDASAGVTVEPTAEGWHALFVDGLASPCCRA